MPGRKQAKSRLEALLSMASGAVAEPVAGLAGLLGLATGGARRGADAVEKTRAALTYQPRDPSAMQELGRLIEPITSRIEQGKRYLGDSAYNATGSPALAAAAYTAPEGLAAMLGLRGAGMKGPTMQQMAQRTGELPSMGSPASQMGIFAGQKARTADHGAMQRAAARLAAGDDPRVVWREEGWMRGPDGEMRFEIDDSRSALTGIEKSDEFARTYKEGGIKMAGDRMRELQGYVRPYRDADKPFQNVTDVFQHDELAAAYPDQWRTAYTYKPEMEIGSAAYDPLARSIDMGPASPSIARGTLLHELQHDAQRREGFASGGTPGSAVEAAQAQEFNTEVYTPHDLYQRLAGEAEARAVQKRMDYTPEQRRAIYPLDDYDVPLDELIFRNRGSL